MRPLALGLVMLWLSLPTICSGAVGDVTFRIPDTAWHLDPGELSLSLDVFVDIESQASVPATAWGMVVTITPQEGASGSVVFDPPAIVGDLPNLAPSSIDPFLDFDRDTGGMSYGMTVGNSSELNAFSAYVEPELGPAPSVDGNGNLALPDGAGLASLPITASANAAGQFLISFDPRPAVTGVVYATGLSEPDDLALHPVGTHVAGLLTIVNPPGDYNLNGEVDAADYTVWRDALGASGTNLVADGDGSGMVGQGDYNVWRNNFGDTLAGSAGSVALSVPVPEPATAWLLLGSAIAFLPGRHRPPTKKRPRLQLVAKARSWLSFFRSESERSGLT